MNRAKAFIGALVIGNAGCGGSRIVSPHYNDIAHLLLSSDSRELEVGGSVMAWVNGIDWQGSFSTTDIGAGAVWTSTPSGIVAFNGAQYSDGTTYIVGVAPGSCVVTVSAGRYSVSGDWTVFPQVASLSISVDTQTVRVGDTIFVHAAIAWKNGAPANGARPTVSVSAEGSSGINRIWTVPGNGETIKLVALAAGTTVLTASLFGGRYTASAPFTIAY